MPKAVPYNMILRILLLSAVILSCENNEEEVRKISSRQTGVEVAKDVVITYTIAGKPKSVLKAPRMLRVQDSIPFVEFPDSVHADFYNEDGIIESILDAHYAKYRENEAIIFMRDSIRVINSLKGDTLYCNELIWDQKRTGREFYTDKPVRIRTPSQVIDGVGMESGQDFRNWEILNPRGTIAVPSSSFPE